MSFNPPATEPGASFTRSFAEETAIAFSAFDSVLNGEKAVYASSELTSGRRLHALLEETGASRASELRTKLGDHGYHVRLWNPNVEAAMSFARTLHQTLGGNQIVITPAPFSAPGWTQRQYLSFWETLLRTRISSVYFNAHWQYSNGCTFEFAVALEAGLPIFNHLGHPLSPDDGARLMEHAVDVCRRRTDAHELVANFDRVRTIVAKGATARSSQIR